MNIMSPLALSVIAFACILAGTLVGMLLRNRLPENHLGSDAKDVVRLGAGLIGTIAALVLGLLIASAKTSFDTQVTQRISAIVVGSDSYFYFKLERLISLAERYRMAMIYYVTGFARDGGLITYGNSLTDMYRLVGVYVGRILKGEKPADLPIIQSSKFD